MSVKVQGATPVIITSAPGLAFRKKMVEQLKDALKEKGIANPSLEDLGVMLNEHLASVVKPPIMGLAERVLAGEFKGDGVIETEEGYRINNPELQMGLRKDILQQNDLRCLARITLIKDLRRLGYRVALLAADPGEYDHLNPDFIPAAREAGVLPEDMVFIGSQNNAPSLVFPRDLFVQIGGTIYFVPGEDFDWRAIIHWAKGLRPDFSRIGFGGEAVIAERFAFLSRQFVPDLAGTTWRVRSRMQVFQDVTVGDTERTLQKMGIEVHWLPPGYIDVFPPEIMQELGTGKRILIPMDHADMHVLYLPSEHALFFGADYYAENKGGLDPVIEKVQPKIFKTLPDDEGAIGSLPLPNGGVYVDCRAERSLRVFRGEGIQAFPSSVSLGKWAWGMQASMHCATNEVFLFPGATGFFDR